MPETHDYVDNDTDTAIDKGIHNYDSKVRLKLFLIIFTIISIIYFIFYTF